MPGGPDRIITSRNKVIANVNKFAFGTSIYCQRHMYVSDLMFLILLKLADGVKDSFVVW